MLLYFSSDKNIGIFDEEAKRLGINIKIETEKYLTDYIRANMYKLNHIEFLAIDLDYVIDEEIELVRTLSSFKTYNKTNIIIVSFEREKGDILLGRLFADGIYNFVTSKDYNIQKNEVKMCLESPNNYANALGYRVENLEVSQKTDKKNILGNFFGNIKKTTEEKIHKLKEENKEKKETNKTKNINNFKAKILQEKVEEKTEKNNIFKEKTEENNIFIEFIEDEKVINYFGKIIGIIENNFVIIDNNFEKDEIKNFCNNNSLDYIFKYGIFEKLNSISTEKYNQFQQQENQQQYQNKNSQVVEVEKIIEVEKVVEKKILIKPKINKTKIAVCGTCARMGATTQAFLIANYFEKYGLNACYIEANGKNSISNIKNFYKVSIDEENKKISYNGIDIFYNVTFEQFPKILTMEYEVFIFDYGEFLQTSEESFAGADFRIVVSGAKAWEEKYIQNVFKICDTYKDINFIFNFVDEDDREFITKNMEELNVYFSNYAPNIFKQTNEKIYNQIFKDYVTFKEIGG